MDSVKASPPGALRRRRSRPVLKNRLKSATMRTAFPRPATTSVITSLRIVSAPSTRDTARNMIPKTARAAIPGAESNLERAEVGVPSLVILSFSRRFAFATEAGYPVLGVQESAQERVCAPAALLPGGSQTRTHAASGNPSDSMAPERGSSIRGIRTSPRRAPGPRVQERRSRPGRSGGVPDRLLGLGAAEAAHLEAYVRHPVWLIHQHVIYFAYPPIPS